MALAGSVLAGSSQFSVDPSDDDRLKVIDRARGQDKLEKITDFLSTESRDGNQAAFGLLEQGDALVKKSKDTTKNLSYYYHAGLTYRYHGNLEEALSAFEEGLTQSKSFGDTLMTIDLLNQLSRVLTSKGEFNQARSYDSLTLRYASQIADSSKIFLAKNHLAITYLMQGEYIETLKIYDSYLDQCPDSIKSCWVARGQQGVALNRTGKPAKAIEILLKVSQHYETQENYFSKSYVDHHIGFILSGIGLYVQALEYYIQVQQYFTEHYNKEQLIHINKNIGLIFLELDLVDSAEVYFERSQDLIDDNYQDFYPELLVGFGRIESERGNFTKAKNYYREALQFNTTLNDKIGFVENNLNLASLFLENDLIDSANQYLDSALPIIDSRNLLKEKVKLLELYSLFYEKQKLTEQVDSVKQIRQQLKNELLSEDKKKEIDKSLVLNVLNKTNANPPSFNTQSPLDLRWVIGLFLSVLIGVFGVIIYRRKKKRNHPQPSKSRIKEAQALQLRDSLEKTMQEDKPYLNPNLSLSELADQISTSDKNLSHVLNQHLNISFYDYLNKARINEFLAKLESGEHQNYSLTGIALECGFKSKSNFYRAFKREKNTSPKDYIEKMRCTN